jgi:tetratricopeptide (TPR) repeat protein
VLFTGCTPSEQRVTNEEAAEFSASLEKDVRDMKIDFIEKNIVTTAFLKRFYSTGKVKQSAGIEKELRQMLGTNQYEKNVYDLMGGKGSFTKVKQYEKEGKQHIIYRLRGGGGFTYMDMELTSLKKQVGIADMFLYNTGENLSASVADVLEKLLSHQESSIQKILQDRLINLSRHLKNADYKLAKNEFDLLPYNLRNSKLYEMRYLDILSKLDQKEYLDYQKQIENKYAGDPGFQLMMIDVYINQQEWDKAISSIDQVDSAINKDPFLDYYRGLILNMKGDSQSAIEHYEKTNKGKPKISGGLS